MPYSTADIIYLAGLFDGDGTVSLSITDKDAMWRASPYLEITNNSYEVMEWLNERFPGRLRDRPGRAHNFTFRIAIDNIMKEMLPYLIIKRGDIEHALAMRSRTSEGPMTIEEKIYKMGHAAKIYECHQARRRSGTRGSATHKRLLEAIDELRRSTDGR